MLANRSQILHKIIPLYFKCIANCLMSLHVASGQKKKDKSTKMRNIWYARMSCRIIAHCHGKWVYICVKIPFIIKLVFLYFRSLLYFVFVWSHIYLFSRFSIQQHTMKDWDYHCSGAFKNTTDNLTWSRHKYLIRLSVQAKLGIQTHSHAKFISCLLQRTNLTQTSNVLFIRRSVCW